MLLTAARFCSPWPVFADGKPTSSCSWSSLPQFGRVAAAAAGALAFRAAPDASLSSWRPGDQPVLLLPIDTLLSATDGAFDPADNDDDAVRTEHGLPSVLPTPLDTLPSTATMMQLRALDGVDRADGRPSPSRFTAVLGVCWLGGREIGELMSSVVLLYLVFRCGVFLTVAFPCDILCSSYTSTSWLLSSFRLIGRSARFGALEESCWVVRRRFRPPGPSSGTSEWTGGDDGGVDANDDSTSGVLLRTASEEAPEVLLLVEMRARTGLK